MDSFKKTNKEKSKGLGDSIAKITHKLKIDKVADYVSKLVGLEGCGCEERRQYLNELFPYKETVRKFVFLKDFDYSGINYKKNQKVFINQDHDLYNVVINLVADEVIKEL